MSADHDFEGTGRPSKRLRTEDLPPQSSPTAQAGTAALNNLTHHDEFWFEDGSIVLVAGNTGFCVYRALLAAQSTIFADMFSSSSPDVEESSTNARLFAREFAFSFHQIASVVRLAHKYHVPDALAQALSALQERFPESFDAWESRHDHRTSRATPKLKLKVRPRQAIGIINLARLVDHPALLPLAFYKCAALGSAVLEGYKREDRSVEHLARRDAQRCIDGRVRLAEAALAVLAEVFAVRPCEGCASKARCGTALQAMLRDAMALEGALTASVLGSWRGIVNEWARERGLCGR
uniref:Probable 3-oxoacyl-[acyl-carrier-protein] reductase oxidoreductase (EC) n=1 Tax=Ganoderma boninense TaxID=34458 RepID=A0A5K1K5J5_9APHY|nr:Probable 3-oxoacyl-[acyl-carrier-protein] reductase oxidoreductase (EC [Ganoderma boninense]